MAEESWYVKELRAGLDTLLAEIQRRERELEALEREYEAKKELLEKALEEKDAETRP